MLETRTSAPLYPPRVRPAPAPVRFPKNLVKVLANNVELIPEQAYTEATVLAPGPPRVAFFTGPEAVQTLLMDRELAFPKAELQNRALEPLIGRPIFSAQGQHWRWQRAVVAPLFRYEELLPYGPVMTAAAEAIIDKWRAATPGSVHPIDKDMQHAAFWIISKTMLEGGADDVLKAIEQGHSEYFRSANWWAACAMLGLPSGSLVRVCEP